MAFVQLDTKQITDWASFHLVCKEAFGFPDFYGRNMDAWIDCMSYLTENEGMTRFVLSKDEILHIEVTNTEDFSSRLPEVFNEFIVCSAIVNNRYLEDNETPKIALIFL